MSGLHLILILALLIILARFVWHLMYVASCPGYYKRMPKPEPGRWLAGYTVLTPFSSRDADVKEYDCRRKAYKAARSAAWIYDQTHPCPEIGVDWRVMKLNEVKDENDNEH